MISGIEPGGQLMITTDVENYPGYENPIQGPWLMEQMKKQSELLEQKLLMIMLQMLILVSFLLKLIQKRKIFSYSVIIATGAKAKWLGVPGEDEFKGFGVSACATCDGFFFKNKNVVVVGGGNTAAEETIFLSNICKKVTLIHRRDKLRAEKIYKTDYLKKNVEVIWNNELKEIIGENENKLIKKIIIKNTKILMKIN